MAATSRRVRGSCDSPCGAFSFVGLVLRIGDGAGMLREMLDEPRQFQERDRLLRCGRQHPGSNHAYQLTYAGSSSYLIYRDGSLLYNAGGFGGGSCVSQAGLEISNGGFALTYATADTFNATPLWAKNPAGYWTVGWPGGHHWIDWPCGVYRVPNCMNGAYFGANYWADNKPS